MPVAADILMVIVAAFAALSNHLVSSALPNVPSQCPKQAVSASKTGRFKSRNGTMQGADAGGALLGAPICKYGLIADIHKTNNNKQ